jgi:hypothetical protein
MRSYKDEGRSFLPIASTIDSISEKSTLKTLRTRNNVRATLLGTRRGTRAGTNDRKDKNPRYILALYKMRR